MNSSAVRRRRVRLFQVFFVALLLPALLFAAFLWQDKSITPGLSYSMVGYSSAEGANISGVVIRPAQASGALPGVLVVHDFGSRKAATNGLSVEIARHGFIVMAVDLRDHGMSTGTSHFVHPDFEGQDVLLGLAYLRSIAGVNQTNLAMVGLGMGGSAVLLAAANPEGRVNATVTWSAPMDFEVWGEHNPEGLRHFVSMRPLPPSVLNSTELRARSPLYSLNQVRPNSTLFLAAQDDPYVPWNQSESAVVRFPAANATYEIEKSGGHNLEGTFALERTISFIELRTRGIVSPALAPLSSAASRDAAVMGAALGLMTVPLAWLAWERICSRNPATVRHYNFPGDRTRIKALAFLAADVAAVFTVVWIAGLFAHPGPEGAFLGGVLPSPSAFEALLLMAALLIGAAAGLSYAERAWRGRDEKKFEEAEPLRRSSYIAACLLVLPLASMALGWLLYEGPAVPGSWRFGFAFALFFIAALGVESVVRLRVQRRTRQFVDVVFGRSALGNSLGTILVGTLLYGALMAWISVCLLRAFPVEAGLTALGITTGAGVLSSLLYDRTRNILAGAVWSALFMAWSCTLLFNL